MWKQGPRRLKYVHDLLISDDAQCCQSHQQSQWLDVNQTTPNDIQLFDWSDSFLSDAVQHTVVMEETNTVFLMFYFAAQLGIFT